MPRAPSIPATLTALLLIARAAADWVEISQQHYQKPIKFHTIIQNVPKRNAYAQDTPLKIPRDPYLDVRPVIKDVTVNPRNPFLSQNVLQTPTRETYLNHSISEYEWNDKPRLGNRRDNIMSNATKKPDDDRNVSYDRRKYEIRKNNGPDLGAADKDKAVSGKIERVPNIGSVKRVELVNTPVKSPTIGISKASERNPNRRQDNSENRKGDGYSRVESNIETETYKESHKNISITPSRNFEHKFSIKKVPIIHGKLTFSETSEITTPFHGFTSEPSVDLQIEKHTTGNTRYKPFKMTGITEDSDGDKLLNNIATNRKSVKHQELLIGEDFLKLVNKNDNAITSKNENPVQETTENELKFGSVNTNKKENSYILKEHKSEEIKPSSERSEEINSSSNEIKINTIESMLKFVKVVADTISTNTRRGANGKIAYLNELKDTLLNNIKARIETAWPDDEVSARRRRRSRSRSGPASARGHVEFPSSESALMTISFLTFAVFLIKLVLQVIQTYKHKAMVMAPLMVATAGRNTARKLRESNYT